MTAAWLTTLLIRTIGLLTAAGVPSLDVGQVSVEAWWNLVLVMGATLIVVAARLKARARR